MVRESRRGAAWRWSQHSSVVLILGAPSASPTACVRQCMGSRHVGSCIHTTDIQAPNLMQAPQQRSLLDDRCFAVLRVTCDPLDQSRVIMARSAARVALLNPLSTSRSHLEEATAGATQRRGHIGVGHATLPSRMRAYRPARTRGNAVVGRNEGYRRRDAWSGHP